MTSPLRIGMIRYRNAAPFRSLPPPFPVEWVEGAPSDLTAAMARGKVDVCLLPTAAMVGGPPVKRVGGFGIGAHGRVLSVLLFCRRPLAAILQDGRPVYVTPQSTTTRALLTQLCLREYGVAPVVTSERAVADARLIIGDEAMDEDQAEHKWPIVHDMAEWWFESTGLPFVFALWVARPSIPETRLVEVRRWLDRTLQHAFSEAGRIALRAHGVEAGWSPARSDLYYQRLRFRLQDEDFKGMQMFQDMIREAEHVAS